MESTPMSAKSIRRLVTLAVLAGTTVVAGPATATTYNWTQTAGGMWSVPGNWDANGVAVSGATNNETFVAGTYTATNDLVGTPFVTNNFTFGATGTVTIAES